MSDRRVIPGGGFVLGLIASVVLWVVIFLVLATLSSGKAHAQDIPLNVSPDSGKYVAPTNALSQGALAVTSCGSNGLPQINYRPDVPMDSLVAAQITAHEMVHVAQLMPDSTGTCEQKLLRITSSVETLLDSEAEAYCAQMNVAREQAGIMADDLQWFRQVVRMLGAYFRGQVEPGDISHALMSHCQPHSVTIHVATSYTGGLK